MRCTRALRVRRRVSTAEKNALPSTRGFLFAAIRAGWFPSPTARSGSFSNRARGSGTSSGRARPPNSRWSKKSMRSRAFSSNAAASRTASGRTAPSRAARFPMSPISMARRIFWASSITGCWRGNATSWIATGWRRRSLLVNSSVFSTGFSNCCPASANSTSRKAGAIARR